MCHNQTLFISFFLLFNLLQVASAKVYDWTVMSSHDLEVVENSQIEAEFRLALINNAKESIDVATFDQRSDKLVGLPILKALKNAADRGVAVRFIRGSYVTTAFNQYYSEPTLHDPVYKTLMNPPAKSPIQYILVGGYQMLMKGWSVFAGAHEKLLLIDGRIALVTGRGNAKAYLNWLDTCFIFKGPLVNQAQDGFNLLWDSVRRENNIQEKPTLSKNASQTTTLQSESVHLQESHFSLNKKERNRLQHLKSWANQPPQDPTHLPASQKLKARVLHHDFLNQMKRLCKKLPWFYNYFRCSKQIQDPILNELIQLVEKSQKIQFYTTGPNLQDQLKQAITVRLKENNSNQGRDFNLELMTNSKEAYQLIFPYPFAWYTGLPILNELLQDGATVYTFNKAPHTNSLEFTHRKVAIATMPDGNDTVLFGSHNFNSASTFGNDEMSFEIQSPEFAEKMRKIFRKNVATNGFKLDKDEIQAEQENNTIPGFGWTWKLLLGIAEANT